MRVPRFVFIGVAAAALISGAQSASNPSTDNPQRQRIYELRQQQGAATRKARKNRERLLAEPEAERVERLRAAEISRALGRRLP